jgi:hydrogenase expression/formation protein HypE
MSTDSFVVQPLFFPGGSIGELAVNGTVNDLAVSGAVPKFLSASFILEEGFPLAQLAAIVERWRRPRQRRACRSSPATPRLWSAGTATAATSTRRASACCAGIQVGPHRAQPGDAILVSGTIGDHGMAIMSVREGWSSRARFAPIARR